MKVGSKVVFIGFRMDDQTILEAIRQNANLPVRNEIYTIRGLNNPSNTRETFVWLEEIQNTIKDDDGNEMSFNSLLFREIDYNFGENVVKEIVKSFEKEYFSNNIPKIGII